MQTLTRLARFALNEEIPADPVEPRTAIGRRLLDISQAFDEGTLTAEEAEFFLDELALVCEREARRAPRQVLEFLEGALALIDSFECNEHGKLVREVSRLEWNLTRVAVSVSFAEAA